MRAPSLCVLMFFVLVAVSMVFATQQNDPTGPESMNVLSVLSPGQQVTIHEGSGMYSIVARGDAEVGQPERGVPAVIQQVAADHLVLQHTTQQDTMQSVTLETRIPLHAISSVVRLSSRQQE